MRDSTVEQPARKSKRSTAIARKSVRPIACIKLLNLRPDTKLINAIAASMTNRTIRHLAGCTSYRHCVAFSNGGSIWPSDQLLACVDYRQVQRTMPLLHASCAPGMAAALGNSEFRRDHPAGADRFRSRGDENTRHWWGTAGAAKCSPPFPA